MTPAPPLLSHNAIVWLKVILTAAALILLYLRYRRARGGAPSKGYSFPAKVVIVLALLFSSVVFHNVFSIRGGTFVHYGEMFHYYLGSKYFKELGYHELYNAVIVADAEQDNALAGIPFYTDLRTYQNAQRVTALANGVSVKNRFSARRWRAFKEDVAFFKKATGMPRSPGLRFLVTDHGYNASPASTFLLSILTNAVPVTQVRLLAVLDLFLVGGMLLLVFRTFGFELGAMFSIFFYANALNDHEYIAGSLLRYDWLFCIVAAVCLLEKGRHASSAFFLTVSAMLRVFPAVLFTGIAVTILQKLKASRKIDKESARFVLAAAVTALTLFVLPAMSFGSTLKPWQNFFTNTALHNSGVYVNHLGFRGIALFEPSHLSLDRFVQTYSNPRTNDIVRYWQDIKEGEYIQKKPLIALASLLVLVAISAILWKRKDSESESILWPLLLVYTMSYLSHYYYAFLCLFVLLFFRRANTLGGFVPLCLLLNMNVCVLVTKLFEPSPIVFYTLINIYLFVCLASLLVFELYATVFGRILTEAVVDAPSLQEARREVKRKRPRRKARGRRK